MNPIRLTLQIALPVVFVTGGYFGYQKLKSMKPEPDTVEPEVPVPLVDAVAVSPQIASLDVRAQGTVVPLLESNLVAEVSGRLIEVSPNLVNGGFVEEGELLYRIDARDYELAVAQARLGVAQAERRLEEERADAAVAREEWETLGKGDPSPLTLREPQVAEARASVDAAKASLERALLDLERTEVRAPFAARVREKRVDLGEYVTRGQSLATGYGIDVVEVRLPLPDAELEFLDVPLSIGAPGGALPGVTLEAEFAGARHTWRGRIVRTEGQIDARTRMIVAVAQVEDPYGIGGAERTAPLAVGLFVNATIEGRTLEDVLVVPRTAMRGEDTVYTVDAESRLRIRQVAVARRGAAEVVLSSALPDGERLVVSPIEVVTDGMAVRVSGDADAEPAPEAAPEAAPVAPEDPPSTAAALVPEEDPR